MMDFRKRKQKDDDDDEDAKKMPETNRDKVSFDEASIRNFKNFKAVILGSAADQFWSVWTKEWKAWSLPNITKLTNPRNNCSS